DVDEPQLAERNPDNGFEVVHRLRVLVLAAFEAKGHVPLETDIIDEGPHELLLETENDRERQTSRKVAADHRIGKDRERRAHSRSRVEVEVFQ
ncbi:MAG: hypothetical protein V3U22_06460, partial [Vicinamibacteria bacterium]